MKIKSILLKNVALVFLLTLVGLILATKEYNLMWLILLVLFGYQQQTMLAGGEK